MLNKHASGRVSSTKSHAKLSAVDSAYRDELDRVGKAQYGAKRRRDQARVRRLRSRVVDGPAIGSGIGRDVYSLPSDVITDPTYESYVIKFASSDPRDTFGQARNGRMQNRTEARIWKQTRCELLVPVVDADPRGYWLVMPAGERIPTEMRAVEQFTEQLIAQCELESLGTDIIEQDIVSLDGTPKLCDYGYNPENR